MKPTYSEKRVNELIKKASVLGYEFINLSEHHAYRNRKGQTFGLIDRRTGTLACAYSLIKDIEKFLAL